MYAITYSYINAIILSILKIPNFVRFLMAGYVPVYLGGLKPVKDTLYMALPLYHSSAGMLALGPSFCFGLCIALRVKFSASNFWKDCVKYNCTVRNWNEVIDCLHVKGSKILLTLITLGNSVLI